VGQQHPGNLPQYRLGTHSHREIGIYCVTQSQLVLSPGLLSNGMAFIWGTKNNIGQLMDYMELMGYVYAENFTFVLLSRNKIPKKAQKSLKGNKTLDSFFKIAPPK
jgi:hypothetical protein